MSWWSLPDTTAEWTGDTPADDASILLAPLQRMSPKPTVDEVLDALEVILRDSTLVVDQPLGERTLHIRERPRRSMPARDSLVKTLRVGIPQLVASYRDELKRAPTLRELVYSISLVFVADPCEYTSDAADLVWIEITD
ncbi:MAG: hypothetical protein ABI678_08765 [Kofleriaceae bacterium]